MSSTSFIKFEVELPSIEEFAAKYPPYGPFAAGEGKFLFELLTAENFLRCLFACELNMPAIAGIAAICDDAAAKQNIDLKQDNFKKQALGAMVSVLMEVNGWEKTGERKAVNQRAFSKGATYKIKEKIE